MRYLREPEPERGIRQAVLPGIDRVVAPNQSAHTYHGTNSFLFEAPEGTVVLDPGPDDAAHVAALLRATGGRVALILLTHTHPDHVGAAPALAAATGAPVAAFAATDAHLSAFAATTLPDFAPDIALQDGSAIAGMVAVHTPGHAADHLCFARPDGTLFSGDHVMAWSSSTISPPGGDMAAYIASLDRLLARPDRLYVPAHGPILPDPHGYVAELRAHRLAREAAILAALAGGPATASALVRAIYPDLPPALHQAAARTMLAHLVKLAAEDRVQQPGVAFGQPTPAGIWHLAG